MTKEKLRIIENDYWEEKADPIDMTEVFDLANAAIEQEPKTEWILVKDNLPIVGEDVLICDYDGDMYISYLHTDGRWGFDYGGNKIKNVIAWQPLPKPYSEVEQ